MMSNTKIFRQKQWFLSFFVYLCHVINDLCAGYATGIELEQGALIELSCELPEAIIYYTTDGTCPCESTSKKYDAPIPLNGNMLIKAMAVAPGYADSDIAELNFLMLAIIDIPSDITRQASTATYTLSGVKVKQDGQLPKGIYIRNGQKVVVK